MAIATSELLLDDVLLEDVLLEDVFETLEELLEDNDELVMDEDSELLDDNILEDTELEDSELEELLSDLDLEEPPQAVSEAVTAITSASWRPAINRFVIKIPSEK